MKLNPTEKQQEIIHRKSGLFTVRACPGSGKTFSVAARLNRLLLNWGERYGGIATISFTNVAWQEIQGYLEDEFGPTRPVGYPHFLGTIDSFINRFIFLPFGHLVMGCNERPTLIGQPHNDYEPVGSRGGKSWGSRECNKQQCSLNDFTYDHDGTFVHLKNKNLGAACSKVRVRPCTRIKAAFVKKGYATQSDANYFALKILRTYSSLAKALATRFPVLMVDEAQDTSRIQMAIIDLLIENGVKEVMLVGDPDQAIYEWREAEPTLFLEKCREWAESSVELNENWRSSQLVCDVANRLSSASKAMMAVNPLVRDCGLQVEVWPYKPGKESKDLWEKFEAHCAKGGVPFGQSGILARGTALLNEIRPGSSLQNNLNPWRENSLSRGLAKARFLLENGAHRDAYRTAERELIKQRNGESVFRAKELEVAYGKKGFSNWRTKVFQLLNELPSTNTNLAAWVMRANVVLSVLDPTLPKLQIKQNSSKCRYGELSCADVFASLQQSSGSQTCHVGTVHSVKGRTLEGVMLVLTKKAGRRTFYVKILDHNITEEEELRILYVAITRPKRILVLVVPEEQETHWRRRFKLDL